MWSSLRAFREARRNASEFYTNQTLDDILRCVGTLAVTFVHLGVRCGPAAVAAFDADRAASSDPVEATFRVIRSGNRNTANVSATEALHVLSAHLSGMGKRFGVNGHLDTLELFKQRGSNSGRSHEWGRLAAAVDEDWWRRRGWEERGFSIELMQQSGDFASNLVGELNFGFCAGCDHGTRLATLCLDGETEALAELLRTMRDDEALACTFYDVDSFAHKTSSGCADPSRLENEEADVEDELGDEADEADEATDLNAPGDAPGDAPVCVGNSVEDQAVDAHSVVLGLRAAQELIKGRATATGMASADGDAEQGVQSMVPICSVVTASEAS